MIFGNIRKFITQDILDNYDKISWRGQLTLFKNIERVNNAYKLEVPNCKTFMGAITGSDKVNLFDEVGINRIFDYLKYPIYKDLPIADLKIRSFNFICIHELYDENTNKHQIFLFNKGLFRFIKQYHFYTFS